MRARLLSSVVICLLMSASCAREAAEPVAVAVTPLVDAAGPGAEAAGDALSLLAGSLPARADFIGVLDLRPVRADLAKLVGADRAAAARRDALAADLHLVLQRFIGPDASQVQVAAAFMHAESKSFAAVAAGDFGRAPLVGTEHRINGVPVLEVEGFFVARVGAHLAIGSEAGLESVINAHQRKVPALTGSPAHAQHRQLLAAIGMGDVMMSASGKVTAFGAEVLSDGPLAGAKLDTVAAALGVTGVSAAVSGDGPSLTRVHGLIDTGIAAAKKQAEALIEGGRSASGLIEALTGVLGGHSSLMSLDRLEVRKTNGALLVSTSFDDLHIRTGMVAVVASTLAVVAIPAFVKYTRRAKTTEAIDELDKIYKGAALYYTTPHVDRRGRRLPCQFPASTGVTPRAATCCGALGGPDADGDDLCDPDPSAWSHATWSALNFQIAQPHRYVYSFDSSGTMATAGFTATANGDLDCDGIQSTFQRMAFGDPQASAAECSLRGSAAFYVEKETE